MLLNFASTLHTLFYQTIGYSVIFSVLSVLSFLSLFVTYFKFRNSNKYEAKMKSTFKVAMLINMSVFYLFSIDISYVLSSANGLNNTNFLTSSVAWLSFWFTVLLYILKKDIFFYQQVADKDLV